MNKFNAVHGNKPTDPRREWNIQPSACHFKYGIFPPKASPVVLFIIGWHTSHAIDNDDVEVHPSEYQFEYTSEYVPDPDSTQNKLTNDDEMDQLLELYTQIIMMIFCMLTSRWFRID